MCIYELRYKSGLSRQYCCEQAKDCGTHLFLDKKTFDPNEYFGQPYGAGSTNKFKLLECHLDCQGSE